MILEAIFDALFGLLKVLFSFIQLPEMPSQVQSVLNEFVVYMDNGFSFLSLFIDFKLVRVLLPLLIVLINFEKLYKVLMFVLRKIPFLGIK